MRVLSTQHKLGQDMKSKLWSSTGDDCSAREDRELQGPHRNFKIPMVRCREMVIGVEVRIRGVVPAGTGPIGVGKHRP